MNQLLLQYSYLQVLDYLTTVAFMINGVKEGNPLVRLAVHYSPYPWGGLLAVKLAAVALGLYCWTRGKDRLLGRINLMFAVLVAWNLAALIMATAQHGVL